MELFSLRDKVEVTKLLATIGYTEHCILYYGKYCITITVTRSKQRKE